MSQSPVQQVSRDLTETIVNIKVSSVLNRNTREYGKKHLTDKHLETCWNSEQGSSQYIAFEFAQPQVVNKLYITFQGGFAGKSVELNGILSAEQLKESAATNAETIPASKQSSTVLLGILYPQDSNSNQALEFKNTKAFTKYKIVFPESTDFYGRITIYSLQIHGY
ncbi:hypothetical protein BB561_001314 [Smittium simulii]|uniref:SUN domain-containing protein n=1 Tax=Smittium simulii TaxID=133385 RepID=A0A2T9YV46_9FUNG|nr:hypothetical protein BB561_001314 [Smittium simulii]